VRPARSSTSRRKAAQLALLLLGTFLALDSARAVAATISAELHPSEVAVGQDARLSVTVVGVQDAPAPRVPPGSRASRSAVSVRR
jgi:hypothetical protein